MSDRVRNCIAKNSRGRARGSLSASTALPLALADVGRVMLLYQGRIEIDGPPETVIGSNLADYGLETPLSAQIGAPSGFTQGNPDTGRSGHGPIFAILFRMHLLPAGPNPPPVDSSVVLALDRVSFELDRKADFK